MDGCLSIGLGKVKDGADLYAFTWGAANGGTRGIYCSTDKGSTWERINDDARTSYGGPMNGGFVTGDMNVYGRVYMSTAGRGIVYGNIGAWKKAFPRDLCVCPIPRLAQAGFRSSSRRIRGAARVFQRERQNVRSQMIPEARSFRWLDARRGIRAAHRPGRQTSSSGA